MGVLIATLRKPLSDRASAEGRRSRTCEARQVPPRHVESKLRCRARRRRHRRRRPRPCPLAAAASPPPPSPTPPPVSALRCARYTSLASSSRARSYYGVASARPSRLKRSTPRRSSSSRARDHSGAGRLLRLATSSSKRRPASRRPGDFWTHRRRRRHRRRRCCHRHRRRRRRVRWGGPAPPDARSTACATVISAAATARRSWAARTARGRSSPCARHPSASRSRARRRVSSTTWARTRR